VLQRDRPGRLAAPLGDRSLVAPTGHRSPAERAYVWPSLRRSCKRTFPLNTPHVCAGMQGRQAARRLLLPRTTARAATAWGRGPRRRSRPASSSIPMRLYTPMVGSADTARSEVRTCPGTAGLLVDQQRIMQECTATAERMLETAAALLQAAQQVRRPLDNTDAHGLSSLA